MTTLVTEGVYDVRARDFFRFSEGDPSQNLKKSQSSCGDVTVSGGSTVI